MKKFLSAVLIFCAMIFPINCQAVNLDYRSYDDDDFLERIMGNWYDTEGNLFLTISNDYKINGHPILKYGHTFNETEFGCQIIYSGANQDEIIELWYSPIKGREFLFITETYNKSDNYIPQKIYALRRTKNPQYYESVGGIYLGMDFRDVIKLYGEPTKIVESNYTGYTLKYEKQGFDLGIYGNIVSWIKIYKYGDRKFDRSGLSARHPKSDFERKYNPKSYHWTGALDIGHDEYIFIKSDYVALALSNNSMFDLWK